MIELKLTNSDKTAIIDNDDFLRISTFTWFLAHHGYIKNNKGEYLHRIILKAKKGQIIDHINMDPLDNRKVNLRFANKIFNSTNRLKKLQNKALQPTSYFKGVTLVKKTGKWKAQIRHLHIGNFENEHEAALAYDLWADFLYKQFARLNFRKAI